MTDSTEKPGADNGNDDVKVVEDQIVEEDSTSVEEAMDVAEETLEEQGESVVEEVEEIASSDISDAEEVVYEEVPEERGTNWAARILFWLILLAAGAAGALWGGPKLAPQLPQWAAPAAKYLTPGGDAALAEAQAVRADVDGQLAEMNTALEALPDTESLADLIDTRLSASLGEIGVVKRLSALEESAGATEAIDAMGTRIGEIEGRLEGLSNDLAGLSEALSKAAVEGGAISAETMAEISANAATMSGIQSGLQTLTGEMGTLSEDFTALAGRMDTIENETLKKAEAAEAAANEQARLNAIENELDAITAAIDAGKAFDTNLAALSELGVAEVDPALAEASDGSLPTTSQLSAELTPLAHQAIRESIRSGAGEGTAGRIGAFLQSQVATRSLEPGEGDGTDAILSRMEAALGSGDLATVASEADGLPEPAKGLLGGWLEKVGARMAALDAVEAISAAGTGGS